MRITEQVRDVLMDASRRIERIGRRQHRPSPTVDKALVLLAELRSQVADDTRGRDRVRAIADD
jgi:hypothetical protein